MSALHYMLKKGSDKRHFDTMLGYGARGDLQDAEGRTAIEIMSRKRDPDFKRMVDALSVRPQARVVSPIKPRSNRPAKARRST